MRNATLKPRTSSATSWIRTRVVLCRSGESRGLLEPHPLTSTIEIQRAVSVELHYFFAIRRDDLFFATRVRFGPFSVGRRFVDFANRAIPASRSSIHAGA
jgi:hypothetical protein